MKKIIVLQAAVLILFFGAASAFGLAVSEEAKRHFDRGVAAVEEAKSPADYEVAVQEFEQADGLAQDVNIKNNDGKMPLYWAAGQGKKEVAELLITKGADINAKNNDGQTPLQCAEINNQYENHKGG